ncbi:MAG: hypothetical protein GY711_05100 [bacterium]|nr:hypothetical protein [bacterium]
MLLLFPLAPPLGPAPLPVQEPERKEADTRGLVVHENEAFDGYTLIAPLTSATLYLLDLEGRIVHTWEPETQTECAILLDGGQLLRWAMEPEDNPRFTGPGVGGGIIERIDWDGKVHWRYVLYDADHLLHHDIALLPNGNVLLLAWEYRSREEAIEAGRDPSQVDERGMWPDAVYEVRPTPPSGGEIVWEWHVWDHLIQDFDEDQRFYGLVVDAPGRIDINAEHRGRPPLSAAEREELEKIERDMAALGHGGDDEEDDDAPPKRRGTAPDWLHTNAIDYLPEHDLILLSVPNMNELWVLDHSTSTAQAAGSEGGRWKRGGEILWRWGNPRNYGAGKGKDQKLSFQHDPTWLPSDDPNELRLLVFNNGRKRRGDSFSSVDELVIPFDPERGFVREPGDPFGPKEPAWTYRDPGTLYSSFISGAQRLPNGNTLICSGAQGRVFEVTHEGKVVWDYRNPLTGEFDHGIPVNSLYRAVRFAADHPGLSGRELKPQ